MTVRIQPYISDNNHARLIALASQPNKTLSGIVDAAIDAYFASSPDGVGGHALLRRFDTTKRQIDRLERQGLWNSEALALFIRYFMMSTPAVPAERQDAARAAGDLRFESFLDQLGIDIQSGKRTIQRAVEEFMIDEADLFTTEELDRLHRPAPKPDQGDTGNA